MSLLYSNHLSYMYYTEDAAKKSHIIRMHILDPAFLGALALYNRSKLLLQNTLITDPQQIPNGLVCTTGRNGGVPRFRFEDGTTIHGRRRGQSTTVQSLQLNQNGRYLCLDGGREWPFYIRFYFNNGELFHQIH